MASHDELIKTIRSHPDWFVHAVLDKKHVIIKLPLGLKVGATATKLLHSFIQTEAATKNEDGLWEGTEQHAVGWKSLSHEHKMAIRTIPTTMTIKTEATTDPKTCGNGNYIKSVKLSEEDKTTVNVLPVCGECADGCKKCFGADVSISVSIFCFSVVLVFPRYTYTNKINFPPPFFFFLFFFLSFFFPFFFFLSLPTQMDHCEKCASEGGEERFLLWLENDPNICYSKSECENEGMVANPDGTCELDVQRPGLEHVSDDDRYASGEKQLIQNDLEKLDFGNTLEKEIGGKTFNTDEYAVKLKNMHDQEAIEYKKNHNLQTETSTTEPAKKIEPTKPELLEMTSTLLQGLATVTSADVGVPLVDDICMIYEEGWQKEGHATLGMLILGYAEKGGRDIKLQTKLDASKSFKGNILF